MLRRLRRVFLWFLKETQNVTISLTALAILRLRNAQSVYLALGATTAGLTAKALKRFIRQPRPERTTKATYGMPSTHSASMTFFGAYLSCLSLFHPLPNRATPLPLLYGVPLALFCLTVSASVCWSRVWFGHHTPGQVLAGASLGAAMGLIAYGVFPVEFGACFDRLTDRAWPVFIDAMSTSQWDRVNRVLQLYLELVLRGSESCPADTWTPF